MGRLFECIDAQLMQLSITRNSNCKNINGWSNAGVRGRAKDDGEIGDTKIHIH